MLLKCLDTFRGQNDWMEIIKDVKNKPTNAKVRSPAARRAVYTLNYAATIEQQDPPLTKNKWPHRRDTKRLEINKAAKRREPNVRGLSCIERNYRSV